MAEEIFEKKISKEILDLIGGAENVFGHANSLVFFIEIGLNDVSLVQLERLHRVVGILNATIKDNNIQVVLGPGKARKATDAFNELLDNERARIAMAPKSVKRERRTDKSFFGRLYQQLMASISHMIPFMLVGGILMAIGFIICAASHIRVSDIVQHIIDGEAFKTNLGAATFYSVGQGITNLVLPVLAGFLAYSIAGKAGIVSGFAGGLAASLGRWSMLYIITATTNNPIAETIADSTSGFLGAMVAGFVAGYSVLYIQKRLSKMPASISGVRDVLIVPIASTFFVLLVMFILNVPMSGINFGIYQGLTNLARNPNLLILSGCIVAMLMATDMGGPINKAAHMFCISFFLNPPEGLDRVSSILLAANVVGLMIPPLGVSLAGWLFPQKFNKEDRTPGIANALCGAFGITEGAIPCVVRDPIRTIISCMAGSAIGGVIVSAWEFNVISPEGGLISIFISSATCYKGLIALVVGVFVTAFLLGFLRPNVSPEKAKLGKFKGIPFGIGSVKQAIVNRRNNNKEEK